MERKLLTFEDTECGIQQGTLNVSTLYSDERRREQFENKFSDFLIANCYHSAIFDRAGDLITYQTECILPTRSDQRPPLLLVFGNPASHSVASEMFFSYEGKKGKEKEHRFWKALRKADILSFSSPWKCDSEEEVKEVNRHRKKELYKLSYTSQFRIGLVVYYTMPSPASGKWAGISGLRRLFGKEALAKICACERDRIAGIIREFVSPSGAVIAFQKDAYLAIKSSKSPEYTLEKAKAGCLKGNCQCDSDIRLFCLPPTRLLLGFTGLLSPSRFR